VRRRSVMMCLLLFVAMPTLGVENGIVMYVGGTVASLREGATGSLDTGSENELAFESAGIRLAIPFARIDSYEYSQQVAHHLGVLPAIGVGLLKKRQRKHFFRITYHDDANTPQVVIFEVPKKMPRMLLAVLQLRAPQGCRPMTYAKCTVQN